MEQYQDIWVKGKLKQTGIREVASRYELIKKQAAKFKRPFTVLDIGANLGYFSIRLTEDFPECTVVALEGLYGSWLKDVLEENNSERVILLHKTFTLDDIKTMSESEHFDMVLAMSVIHHLGSNFKDVLNAIRTLGDIKIVEIATEDNACGQESVRSGFVPEDAKIIGYGKSHLKGPQRPIFVMQDKKISLQKTYIGSTRNNSKNHCIESDYESKIFKKEEHDAYDWHRGINLKTYQYFNGSYPQTEKIIEMLRQKKPTQTHGDMKIHNVILKGDSIEYIDFLEKDGDVYADDVLFEEMVNELKK